MCQLPNSEKGKQYKYEILTTSSSKHKNKINQELLTHIIFYTLLYLFVYFI